MLDNVASWQSVILGSKTLIAVVRWVTYKGDFLWWMEVGSGTEANRRWLTPVIGEVRPLFRDAIAPNDPFTVRRTVEKMEDGELCLLALGRILDVNWDSTYTTARTTCAGRYLYYDFNCGVV